jgi:hypothetical protein
MRQLTLLPNRHQRALGSGMPYVILTRDGEPLADEDGRVFTFETRASAQPLLLSGESIEQWPDWMEERVSTPEHSDSLNPA